MSAKSLPCLATESTNSARMRTTVTAALQLQYSQTEFIFLITLVPCQIFRVTFHRVEKWLYIC